MEAEITGGTILTAIGLPMGAMILGAGLYYLTKERDNAESGKVYGITCIMGLAIVIGILIKTAVSGF